MYSKAAIEIGQLCVSLKALIIGMQSVRDREVLEVRYANRYFFDVDMCGGARYTKILTRFFSEIQGCDPPGVIFALVVEFEFVVELIVIEGIDFVLFDVHVPIGLVLPKGD
jgi:hypothetical protein